MATDHEQLPDSESWPDGDGPLRVVADQERHSTLVVDVEGFEGPLDLLLDLSRRQKVDLTKISILRLADQYLAFIHEAQKMELDLAADYLVMAAWLAYLKSRLLVPKEEDEEDVLSAEELAARLTFRLQRLYAMREAAAQLMAGHRLGRDVFQRGAPEPLIIERKQEYADGLYDLLKAYAERRQKQSGGAGYSIRRLPVWSIKEARAALSRLIGGGDQQWSRLDEYLTEYLVEPCKRPSVIASGFAASLEMAREGLVEIRQASAYQPVYLRKVG